MGRGRLALHAQEQVSTSNNSPTDAGAREAPDGERHRRAHIDITELKQRRPMARMLFDQNPVLMWCSIRTR